MPVHPSFSAAIETSSLSKTLAEAIQTEFDNAGVKMSARHSFGSMILITDETHQKFTVSLDSENVIVSIQSGFSKNAYQVDFDLTNPTSSVKKVVNALKKMSIRCMKAGLIYDHMPYATDDEVDKMYSIMTSSQFGLQWQLSERKKLIEWSAKNWNVL